MNKTLPFLLFIYLNSFAQYSQLGNKLVGKGSIGQSFQGYSVSLSANGKTALIGGYGDNSNQGAVWVYTYNGSSFVQAGNKIIGIGVEGTSGAQQGISVSISGDSKTALIGGPSDGNAGNGSVWIFTFNGSNFVQFGNKLVATDAIEISGLGISVSLSEDGKTALVGGARDNGGHGAAWIFTFNGTNYIQLGNKLVGSGAIGTANQGRSVSLSADGKIALVGGSYDNFGQGAAWIYTFNGNNFVQVGSKLFGLGGSGSNQGVAVSLSGDGQTALVGGPIDNLNDHGAVWVYTFNGNNFVQAGNKLVGTGESSSGQGFSVSLSYDGKTAVIGGPDDNNNFGAIWIYTFIGNSFEQVGSKLSGSGSDYFALQGQSIGLSADGQTILVGGSADHNGLGASWVFSTVFQNTTSIQDFSNIEKSSGLFEVYPNPTSGSFFIKSFQPDKERNFSVNVYNSLGQYIGNFPEGETNLSKGFYLLRCGEESKKLVIE